MLREKVPGHVQSASPELPAPKGGKNRSSKRKRADNDNVTSDDSFGVPDTPVVENNCSLKRNKVGGCDHTASWLHLLIPGRIWSPAEFLAW